MQERSKVSEVSPSPLERSLTARILCLFGEPSDFSSYRPGIRNSATRAHYYSSAELRVRGASRAIKLPARGEPQRFDRRMTRERNGRNGARSERIPSKNIISGHTLSPGSGNRVAEGAAEPSRRGRDSPDRASLSVHLYPVPFSPTPSRLGAVLHSLIQKRLLRCIAALGEGPGHGRTTWQE